MKSPKTPTPNFTANLLANAGGGGEAPAAAPKATTPSAVAAAAYGEKLTTRLTGPNSQWLARAAYWKPGKGQVQSLVNDALDFYRTHKDGYKGTVSPTPDEA